MLETRIQAAVQAAMEMLHKKGRANESSSTSLSDTDDSTVEEDDNEAEPPYKFPKGFSMDDHNKAVLFSEVIKANKDFWQFHIFNYYVTNKRTSQSQCNWVPVFDCDPFKTGFASFCKDAKAATDCRNSIVAKCADIKNLSQYKEKTPLMVHDYLTNIYKNRYL
jgi:hypothetical protein